VLDGPLHDAKIIKQLHECNEEDDKGKLTNRGENIGHRLLYFFHQQNMTYPVDEQPVLVLDGILIEEKCGTDKTLDREIGYEICEPHKHVEASTSLEYEESDHLLCQEADDDSMPLDTRPVLGCGPKSKLEQGQTEHGNCAITIARTLIPQYADQRIGRVFKGSKTFRDKHTFSIP
jgi:hypothetical protein